MKCINYRFADLKAPRDPVDARFLAAALGGSVLGLSDMLRLHNNMFGDPLRNQFHEVNTRKTAKTAKNPNPPPGRVLVPGQNLGKYEVVEGE